MYVCVCVCVRLPNRRLSYTNELIIENVYVYIK